MAKKAHGLGRGLDSLFQETEQWTEGIKEIPVGELDPNPDQPRRTFTEETIAQLAEGILSMGDVGIVGFGVPSSLKPGTDIVIHANNFGWKNKDLRGELKKHLGSVPIYIANDADIAAASASSSS